MSDPVTPICPWCSAVLPSAAIEKCPSCGAALVSSGSAEPVLPGITAIDPQAILRSRQEPPRQRNRLFSFLSGEVPTEDTPGSAGSLEPPPADVRREMLKLEIAAEKSRLESERSANQAEVVALAADQIASGKLVLPEGTTLIGGTGSSGPALADADDASAPVAPVSSASEAVSSATEAAAATPTGDLAGDPGTPPAS